MKRVIKVLLCLLVFILLIGCTSINTTTDNENVSNNQDSEIVVIETEANGFCPDLFYEIFYDKDTKVCYVITNNGGVTPLYNADGSLKIYNEDENNEINATKNN